VSGPWSDDDENSITEVTEVIQASIDVGDTRATRKDVVRIPIPPDRVTIFDFETHSSTACSV